MTMTNRVSKTMVAAMLAAAIGPLVHSAAAQGGAPDRPRGQAVPRNPQGGPGIATAEIQRMLDGYELMQAQEMLKLGDDQFPRFLPRLRALQEVRRRAQMQRNGILQDLRRLTQTQSTADNARVKDSIKSLDDLDARSAMEIRKTRESLDQVLDPYQQARFRLFEAVMEQRKVDLVMRARQANRQNRQNRPPNPSVP